MKNKLYYLLPFIVVPAATVIFDLLDRAKILQMSPEIVLVFLVLISLAFGFFSSTGKKFDYLITVLMPLSFFLSVFIYGFFDEGFLHTQHDLSYAFSVATRPIFLQLYIIMAVATFVASFSYFRNIKKRVSSK